MANIEDKMLYYSSIAKEHYSEIVKIMRIYRPNERIQAEFLNFATQDWILRRIYPEVALIIFECITKMDYKDFDDLSELEQDKIIKFFFCMSTAESLIEEDITDEYIKEKREAYKMLGFMPTL